tara:strand:+ start:298 stop:456 length:159 start_codon:yes stop_codon:yes gene_type:complete
MDIETKQLRDEYDSKEYARNRKKEYDQLNQNAVWTSAVKTAYQAAQDATLEE